VNDNGYRIRAMTRDEVDIAVEWAAQEGWNPGWHDAECYFATDANGFFLGLLGEEPVATLSAVRYGTSFGFLGFYIVKPKYRGQGYGRQIWNAGLRYLEGRNVGLDGVVAQQANYRKLGFTLAHRNVRFAGPGAGEAPDAADIAPLSAVPFETIRAYTQAFFPEDRSAFLRCWIHQPGSKACGVMHNGNLAGYGVRRACRSGYKIGPLFADSSEVAERLFRELTANIDPSEQIMLDVPEPNERAVALAERYRMEVAFETARMYKREVPDLDVRRTFGVTSFEVG